MDRAISIPMSLAELFRTVRVVGERLVFVEPRPGYLINLAHVESIEDDAGELRTGHQSAGDPRAEHAGRRADCSICAPETTPADYVLRACPHGYVMGTCTRCATEAGTTLSEQTRP